MHIPNVGRATLKSTDVTLQVNCDHLMPIMSPVLKNWQVQTSEHGSGSAQYAGSKPKFVDLHEGAVLGGKFAWDFRAYKKNINIGGTMYTKELVCSKPKQPNTRPTTESCCVQKRIRTQESETASCKDECTAIDIIKIL